jgi:hypothetical protein
MDSSDTNSLNLSDYLDFDSSNINNSFDISDLEPMNLDEINIGMGIEQIESPPDQVEPSTDLPEPLTVGDEINMFSIENVNQEPLPEPQNCQTTIEPVDNTINQLKLAPIESNNDIGDINVMRAIQTGGGAAPPPPNNLTRENIVKILGKDEHYIISQIKDIYYDSDVEQVIRNYGIRKISLGGDNKGLVSGDLVEINATDIEEHTTIDDVDGLSKEDVHYDTEEAKNMDNTESKKFLELEEFDPTAEEEDEPDVEDEDLNVMGESNSGSPENTLDEEGFDFEELGDDGIVLEVVQELQESKILFTENEQEEDIIEEMIRNLPKRKRGNKDVLSDIVNQVRIFKYLKNKYSKSYQSGFDIDDQEYNQLKQELRIKGRNYKPLIHDILNNGFNENFIPIASLDLRKYADIGNNVRKNLAAGRVTGEDIDYIKQLDDLEKIYQKYKKDSQLDYNNKAKEIDNLLKSAEPKLVPSIHQTHLNSDITVLENFEEHNIPKTLRLLGKDVWFDDYGNEHISIKGTNTYINGIMVNKENEINDFIFRKTMINKYKQPNLFPWTINSDVDILVSEIDNTSIYLKDDKVKVCVRNKGNTIEVEGTVKSVRKNFIYVKPNDEGILDDVNDILEFDTNSKELKIDKINEIKNQNAYCFNNEKYNVYLFKQDKNLNKKDMVNVLEQIIPSIYQILNTSNLSNITFNEEINRLLMNHGVSYSDLENSNYQIIKKVMNKNIKKIKTKLDKKYDKHNAIKRTYDKIEAQEIAKNIARDFEFLTNEIVDELNKVYDDYLDRPFSFDNEIVRTKWVMNQDDYGKYFASYAKDRVVKSKKMSEKIDVLRSHKQKLDEEGREIQERLEEEVRKNEFFQNPNAQCKEGIVSKISKMYLSITKLDEDNFKEIMVDPQFKTILEDEMVKVGDFCILKDSNNPTISPENVDMTDRIFERIMGEDQRPIWKEKSKGFLADYIREYKKVCQDKGPECKFTNSFGPCEPEIVKRLKQNKSENLEKIEIMNKRINEISDRKKEKELEEVLKYYRGRELLNKKNRLDQLRLKQHRMEEFRKSINLEPGEDRDYSEAQRNISQLADPTKREELIALLKDRYDIDFIDMESPEDVTGETDLGDFNEAGQRITHHESMEGGVVEVEMTDNEILDSVRSYLERATQDEGLSLDDDLETIQSIISVFLQILGVTINTKSIEFKVLSIFNKNIMSMKEFKKQSKKPKDIESKYNKFKKSNLIYYTTSILLVELQIRLNNYFMSHYEKCISSIDGYPIIPPEDEEKVGERFNYGINFFSCILGNLKKGGSYWEAIKDDKKISKNFRTVLDSILKERDFQNRLQRKRVELDETRKMMEEVEQNYLWREYRPFLGEVGQLRAPPGEDLDDCNIDTRAGYLRALRLADEKNKWYSAKIFEKINSIIANENVENIKYDPLPIGNSCCLDVVNRDYDYFNFLFSKDTSGELKKFIEESRRIENICKRKDIKLFYVQPTSIRPKLQSFALDIFPKQGDVNRNILSNVSKNFVGVGENIGKKRIFKKYFIREDTEPVEIDILTNDNKKEIQGEQSEENFFNLVSETQKNNSVKDPITLELNPDMKAFKLETIINTLAESLAGTQFITNTYLNNLVNRDREVLLQGTLSDVKTLWDRMEVELNKVTKEVIDLFSIKKTKDRISDILDNLDNFEKSDIVDKENLEDGNRISLEIGKRKESSYKNYLLNYFKKFVSMLSNGKLKNMEVQPEFDDFTFLNNFTKSKYRKVFRKMREITKHLSRFRCINGLEVIKDCNGSKLEDSRFTIENGTKLLRFIFMLTLKYIVDVEESGEDASGSDSDSDESPGIYSDERKLKLEFVKTILEKIDTDRKDKDKYNAKNNSTEINKKNESQKDRNLYVMQLLDLETRRLRNEQTKAGLVNYADLSRDFEDVLERDEREQQVRSELGSDATDEQVSEEMRRREVTAYESGQVETYDVTEGDDEMDGSN